MTDYPRLDTTEEVTAACAARPDVQPYARIVGAWVWCEFPDKPSDDTRAFLKATGFRWNKERGAWQHPCGVFTRRNRNIDPRQYYGARSIDGLATDPRPNVRTSIDRDLDTFTAANF